MKVKIKKTPRVGDQKDYGLVNDPRLISSGGESGVISPGISDTLQPVPEEQATIEAEKGETILGDINEDGYLEHMNVGGNKHYAGGTPLDVPPGSFVFSNDKNLKIKDEALLKFFGKTNTKKGFTPAELAKKYNINDYIKVLKDDKSDKIQKDTAQLMVDKNLSKLTMLSLVQENMKGYPNGIPELALGAVPQFQEGGQINVPYFDFGTKKDERVRPAWVPSWASEWGIDGATGKTWYKTPFTDKVYFMDTTKKPVDDSPRLSGLPGNMQPPSPQTTTVQTPEGAQMGPPAPTTTPVTPSTTPSKKPVNKPSPESFEQYSPEMAEIIVSQGDNVIYPKQEYNRFGVQHQDEGTFSSVDNNQFDWEDFKQRHGDWIDNEYQGGFEQFVQDVQSKDKTKNTTLWFQESVNDKVSSKYTGKKYFDTDQSKPYALDGKFGQVTFSVPRFWDVDKPPATPKEPTPDAPVEDVIVPTPEYERSPEVPKNWWLPDIANFAYSLTEDVNEYPPALYQMPYTGVDYALLDPARQIAARQEQFNKLSDVVTRTSSGNVARANLIGNAAESAGDIANVIANYENQNVGIVNNAMLQNSESLSRNITANTELRKRYNDENAIFNQQVDNERRQIDRNRLAAFTRGWDNSVKTNEWMRELYPQYAVNPISGEIGFTKGKNMNAPFGFYETDATGGGNSDTSNFKSIYDDAINKGITPEAAEKIALSSLNNNRISKQMQLRMNSDINPLAALLLQQQNYNFGGEYTGNVYPF